jgi:hypothetical protein
MKIGIIIPDRGDREKFFNNCLVMMHDQTVWRNGHEQQVSIISDGIIKASEKCDIVPRVRAGYERLTLLGVDVIFIIENDDWYAPNYIEEMLSAWESFGKPDLFGTCYTIYYHLKLKAYNKMEHHQRSSLMNTMIKPGLDIKWPVDIEPYLDLHLWQMPSIKSRIVFRPEKHISIGMKHNVGKCGGALHSVDQNSQRWYENPDNGFLKATLDSESFEFYNNYFRE